KDKSELIGRTTYGKTTGALKPEFGIEVAQNKLHNFVEDFSNGVFVPEDSEDVHVKELRGEAFATLVYQAKPNLTIESGLTFEASRINVTGDAVQEQNFKFLKPRVAATYSFNDDTQLTLEAERTVGQLDLNNFGSSQEAADDRTTSGNPNLQPDKTKKIGAIFDWKFSERGSLKVEAFHEWRSDILEQIILPDGSEGLGNAGNARFWAVLTDLTLPLDFALPGGLIEIKHFYRRSSFKDPVLNGRDSIISDYTPNWLRFDFRQDLTEHKVSWGLTYWGSFHDDFFNVSEISRMEGNKRLRFFIETTRFFGVKTKFQVSHLNTGKYDRTRFFFDGNRGGDFTGTELSARRRKPEFKIEISGTF
ncbi:MAG: TonB-dependent receptor, partial [Kordiimonas sp.]